MKEITVRIWQEPAVFIGFITTIGVIVVTIVAGNDWDIGTIVGALAPIVSALGIRSQVTPYHGQYEREEET
jgi:ascorbate-specific PTS system EIIC-type component UlaA